MCPSFARSVQNGSSVSSLPVPVIPVSTPAVGVMTLRIISKTWRMEGWFDHFSRTPSGTFSLLLIDVCHPPLSHDCLEGSTKWFIDDVVGADADGWLAASYRTSLATTTLWEGPLSQIPEQLDSNFMVAWSRGRPKSSNTRSGDSCLKDAEPYRGLCDQELKFRL